MANYSYVTQDGIIMLNNYTLIITYVQLYAVVCVYIILYCCYYCVCSALVTKGADTSRSLKM